MPHTVRSRNAAPSQLRCQRLPPLIERVLLLPPGTLLSWCASGPAGRRTLGSASPDLMAAGGWLLMRNVVGCLWTGVTYAGVWAGPTDHLADAVGALRSIPPLAQEATHERVRRVSTGCQSGTARPRGQASSLSRSYRALGGFCAGEGG